MDLKEAIYQRRSIRKYNNKQIEKEVITKIIEAGTMAPSACNLQGWRFIVIDSPEQLTKIVKGGAAYFLKNVSLAILVIYNNQTDNLEYRDHIQSASACIQNMLLAAYELGIGTCWISHLPSKRYLKKVFSIPYNYDPIALISLGYYDQKINHVVRLKNVNKLICNNKFNFEEDVVGHINLRLLLKRILRYVYIRLPKNQFLKECASIFEKKFSN